MLQQVICAFSTEGLSCQVSSIALNFFFIFFYFCCRQVHQAAGGEINETDSFSSFHWSLKREGFRSVLLKEWEDAWRALFLSLHGQLSAPADVVWLRSAPLIAGVLCTALPTSKLFIPVYY